MNEYMVVYTNEDGEQTTEVYSAQHLGEFKQQVKGMADGGYEFAIYQMVPVHTTWEDDWKEAAATIGV